MIALGHHENYQQRESLVFSCHEQKEDLLGEVLEVNWVTSQLPISEKKLEVFKRATVDDAELRALKIAVRVGWSKESSALPTSTLLDVRRGNQQC